MHDEKQTHSCGHDHAEGEECHHGETLLVPESVSRLLTDELVTTLDSNYVTVPSHTAQKWFTNGGLDVVTKAVFQYIVNHPTLFTENGDVILDAIEMANLVLPREEIGLTDGVPEELVAGIIPRQVGMITQKGEPKPEMMKNSILVGNANEVAGMIMSAFRAYYKLEDGDRPRKTAKERFDERRKKRLRDKRKRK